MAEKRDWIAQQLLPENSERVKRQIQQDIRVIIANPPYSAQQESENDNNKNVAYPKLDSCIRETYVAKSKAKLVKNLYDHYIRAIRWASNRIEDKGIVAFVTNGSFLDANNMDGLRKCLTQEFSSLYVFNLRGNQRTSGELSRKEGGKIFGSGSRTAVAITVMIKDPAHEGPCELFYHDIGDYLGREEKLTIIEEFQSIASIPWQRITPNTNGDWINQRDPVFETFMELGNKNNGAGNVFFSVYSQGVLSARDAWVYNFSKEQVKNNMSRMINNYNKEVDRYSLACKERSTISEVPQIEDIIDSNPKRISWTGNLKESAKKGKRFAFEGESVIKSMYRPFCKQWMYFSRRFNERVYKMPSIFPTPAHENIVISVTGIGASKTFSALVSDSITNYHMHDTSQCFPRYWYEKVESDHLSQHELFGNQKNLQITHNGYIRHESINDWSLVEFRKKYRDDSITKEDIFWYIYGMLHSQEYRQRFAADLKKMLPRISFAEDFWAFSNAGRNLAEWHLNYESVEPYPLTEQSKLFMEGKNYLVTKMTFGKKNGKPDKGVIVYNEYLTLHDIPQEAYEYIVNGKSAIEWIMERYAVTVDNDSRIRNDPNEWSDDPRYVVDLLKRIVRVSVESVKVIKGLPALN
jgi:predicted helicase